MQAFDRAQLGMVLLVGGSARIGSTGEGTPDRKEPSRNLNPDECVALGATVRCQAWRPRDDRCSGRPDPDGCDATFLSIETVGGIATKIIDRNTTIPAPSSKVFTTAANFQTSVNQVRHLQGERQFRA